MILFRWSLSHTLIISTPQIRSCFGSLQLWFRIALSGAGRDASRVAMPVRVQTIFLWKGVSKISQRAPAIPLHDVDSRYQIVPFKKIDFKVAAAAHAQKKKKLSKGKAEGPRHRPRVRTYPTIKTRAHSLTKLARIVDDLCWMTKERFDSDHRRSECAAQPPSLVLGSVLKTIEDMAICLRKA